MRKLCTRWTLAIVAISSAFGVTYRTPTAEAAISGQTATNTDTTVSYQYSWSGSTVARRDVFIDADQGPSGYAIGGIFAEYLVQEGSLYKFNGASNTNWAWA